MTSPLSFSFLPLSSLRLPSFFLFLFLFSLSSDDDSCLFASSPLSLVFSHFPVHQGLLSPPILVAAQETTDGDETFESLGAGIVNEDDSEEEYDQENEQEQQQTASSSSSSSSSFSESDNNTGGGAERKKKGAKHYNAQQRKKARLHQLHQLENGAIKLSGLKAYKEFISHHPYVFIMYYAPWCYWSRATLPEFNAAARILAHHEPPVILAQVDASTEEEIANFADIREFPTLKLFIDGAIGQTYNGRRHRTHLVHWIDSRLDRDKALTSIQFLDEIMRNHDEGHLVIIGVFPSENTNPNENASSNDDQEKKGYVPPSEKAFVSVARQFGEDVFFGHIQEPSIIDHLKTRHISRLYAADQQGNGGSSSSGLPAEVESRISSSKPFVVVFSKNAHEPPVHIYEGNLSNRRQLHNYIGQYRFPLISIFDADRLPSNFFSDARPKAVLIMDSKRNPNVLKEVEEETSSDPLVQAFIQSARTYRHALLSTVCGNTTPFEKHLYDLLGLDEDSPLPALRIMSVNPESDGRHHPALKYRPEEEEDKEASSSFEEEEEEVKREGKRGPNHNWGGRPKKKNKRNPYQYNTRKPIRILTPEVISRFFENFVVKRNVLPYYRSEAVVVEENETDGMKKGSVKTVVSANFYEVVYQSKEDVFIEFYAPWCGYCRKLEPAYKELALRLKDVPGILIAKIDATRNEVPGIKVMGYPTIFLFPANRKLQTSSPPLAYNGDRSVEDMLKWLSTRTSLAQIHPDQLMSVDLATLRGEKNGVQVSVLEEL
ncbi:protein disulfide-isomerase [Cystoisospora suis]|uniref:Protein disulfide-isomerase n=1 Tax=Cystoisospora suis TaxID=483139 RepID=A0A2C6L898_9APIC|nr:protein disulfide-isomerase [Cystoisospora suis]